MRFEPTLVLALAGLCACTGSGRFLDTSVDAGPSDPTTEPGPTTPPDDGAVTEVDAESSDVTTVPRVHFTLTEEVDGVLVEYSFDEGIWLRSPEREGYEGAHSEYLLGVPELHDVLFRIVTLRDGDETVTESEWSYGNGPAPSTLPDPNDLFFDASMAHDHRWVLGSLNDHDGGWTTGNYTVFLMDRQGRFVWGYETPDDAWALYPRVSKEGNHLILDASSYWASGFDATDSVLRRMTLDGMIWETIGVPGLHHSWDERDDGTIIWGSVLSWTDETIDYLVEGEGPIQSMWSCSDWLDEIGSNASCESNTVNWDPATDTVVFSFYTNDTVVEVQYPTGETNRQYGALPRSFEFDPPSSRFTWQHGTHYTTDGTLLLSTHPIDGTAEQRAREYLIDDDTQTLVEIWNYGEGTGKFAPTAGEVYRLDNGNYLINYGGMAGIREITSDSEIAWDVSWSGSKLIGHTTLVDDLYALLEGPASK